MCIRISNIILVYLQPLELSATKTPGTLRHSVDSRSFFAWRHVIYIETCYHLHIPCTHVRSINMSLAPDSCVIICYLCVRTHRMEITWMIDNLISGRMASKKATNVHNFVYCGFNEATLLLNLQVLSSV